jgi:hypothetical protein
VAVIYPTLETAEIVDLVTGEIQGVKVGKQANSVICAGDDLVVGYKDGKIERLSAAGEPRWSVDGGRNDKLRWDLQLHNGRLHAVGFRVGIVEIFDVATGELVQTLEGEHHHVYGVDVAADGRVAFGNVAPWAQIWSPEGERLHLLDAHAGPALDVAFSPSGDLLATADYNWQVRLFDAREGRLLYTDEVHRGPVGRVVWLSERSLLSVGMDTLLRRDLDAPSTVVAGYDAFSAYARGDATDHEKRTLAAALHLHGLHRAAAELHTELGDDPLAMLRGWYQAGEPGRGRPALQRLDTDPATRAGWARVVNEEIAAAPTR